MHFAYVGAADGQRNRLIGQNASQFRTVGIHTEFFDNRDELEIFDNAPSEVRGIFLSARNFYK